MSVLPFHTSKRLAGGKVKMFSQQLRIATTQDTALGKSKISAQLLSVINQHKTALKAAENVP